MNQSPASSFAIRLSPIRLNRVGLAVTVTWALFLVFLFAAPIIRVGGLPVPTILVGGLLLLASPKVNLGPRSVWLLCGVAALYLLVVSLVNRPYNPQLGLKDIFYFMIPVQFLVGMALFNTVFQSHPKLSSVFIKFCRAFLIFQFVAVVAEFLSFGPFLAILRPYLQWFLVNTSSTDAQLDYINLRPSGTLGNPVLLGVVAYIIGRFISHVQQKPTYFVLGLSLVILTASRTAAIAIVIAEGMAYLFGPLKPIRFTLRQFRNFLAFVGLIIGMLIVMFITVPFTRVYLDVLTSGKLGALSDDYSVTYRNQMIAWAFQQKDRLLFGGLSLAEAPDAVDSEVLMRSLQFGILGYLALQAPVWSFLTLGRQSRFQPLIRYAIALIVFCGICSTTFSPFSNPYFVVWYAAIAGYWCAAIKALPDEKAKTAILKAA